MTLDTRKKLSPITIALHWIVAIIMIGLLGSGLYMTQFEAYDVYPIHKSFGAIIAVFVLLRVLWRIKNGWPQHVGEYSTIEKLLSKITHYALIIGTILMPISGMLMSVMSGRGLFVFGIEVIGKNMNTITGERESINDVLAGNSSILHEYAAYVIIVALALHIIGALKHHVIDKDATLKRMLGRT